MKETDNRNREIQDSNWKKGFNNLKKQKEQGVTKFLEKMKRKFRGLMKVPMEIACNVDVEMASTYRMSFY